MCIKGRFARFPCEDLQESQHAPDSRSVAEAFARAADDEAGKSSCTL
jgi:hypothetical protein